jgi:hypothetical protein
MKSEPQRGRSWEKILPIGESQHTGKLVMHANASWEEGWLAPADPLSPIIEEI